MKRWYDDPLHPGRQVGWTEPETTPDYVRPVKRLVIRWHKRNGQTSYGMLISTLAPRDVLGLLGQPASDARDPEKPGRAYAQLYDQRGGAVEIEIKEDKQGFGMVKRQKRKAEAQDMLELSPACSPCPGAPGRRAASRPRCRSLAATPGACCSPRSTYGPGVASACAGRTCGG